MLERQNESIKYCHGVQEIGYTRNSQKCGIYKHKLEELVPKIVIISLAP